MPWEVLLAVTCSRRKQPQDAERPLVKLDVATIWMVPQSQMQIHFLCFESSGR